MFRLLLVQWQLIAGTAPQPLLSCRRCGGARPFRHRGKFRLNACGKRLNAWLIYRCTDCDNTWNRPVFERRSVRAVDAPTMQALQRNDPTLAQALAFDTTGLPRIAETNSAASIQKTVLSKEPEPWSRLEIRLRTETPPVLRLDRLLASELGLSRSRLQKLEKDGRLRIPQGAGRALRQAVKDGTRVYLELSELPDRNTIAGVACGS